MFLNKTETYWTENDYLTQVPYSTNQTIVNSWSKLVWSDHGTIIHIYICSYLFVCVHSY